MNQKKEQSRVAEKRSGSSLLGILTLISVFCFLALVVMQILEFMTYGN